MLRRLSVKSKSDLKRRKSTSSTHGVHLEHIDQAVAQRDAQIAACEAYSRAQNRTRSETPLFPPTPESSPRRRQANSSGIARDENRTPCHGREHSQDLRHRQSVRFMGPCSVQGRANQGRGADPGRGSTDLDPDTPREQDEYDRNSLDSYILGNNDNRPSAQQLCRPSRDPPPVPLPRIAADYLDALVAGDEYYTPEDDIASAPSSFRRLRRSRSMFTSDEDDGIRRSQEGSHSFLSGVLHGSKVAPSFTNRRMLHSDNRENRPSPTAPRLRAPKSMSFLRTRNIRSGSNTSGDCNNRSLGPPEISRLSEDDRSHASEQGTPRLLSKPSAFFSSRSRRAEPGIRKSLRSSSPADGFGPSNTHTAPIGKEDGLKVKARKVSKSLKTKFKSFFSLVKSEEEPPSVPNQHIEAQRTHVTEGFGSILSSASEKEPRFAVDWSSIHRVPSKIPSLQTVPANLLHSNKGSLESLRSERERKVSDDKSLTSWANSGPSTLTSQQQQQWKEWERQRLSIIKENGTHAPSPSIRRRALGTQLFQHDEIASGCPTRPGPIIDSQRVYSALMKRVREANNQTSQVQGQHDNSGNKHTNTLRSMRSEESLGQALFHTPRAIRCVALDRDSCNTPTRASKNPSQVESQVLQAGQTRTGSPATPSSRRRCLEPARICAVNKGGRSASASTSISRLSNSCADPFTGDDRDPTWQVNPICGEEGQQPHPEQFPASLETPTAHLFRTASPYRRALRDSIREEEVTRQQRRPESEPQTSESGTQIHVVQQSDDDPRTDSESANYNDYSESVYSTDEAGDVQCQDTPRAGENPDQAMNRLVDGDGPACSPLTYRPAGYRVDSSASSIDWKTWLSANVAKLEPSPASKPSEVEYALPTMPKSFPSGHIRELAQTHDDYDDEDLDVFELPTHKPTLPTTPLATVEPNVVKLSPQQRSVKRTTPPSSRQPLLENDSPICAPPIPVKSALRSTPSHIKRAGHSITPSVASSPGLTAAVQRQFGPVAKRSLDFNTDYQRYGGPEADSGGDEDGDHTYENYGMDNRGAGRMRIVSSDETRAFI
ncbi:hypothetical protein B0T22DRAFT_66627 [Podospora appendiculata]|uniref:Uncharacterized protein n=1 Tax=Podospora appendiculata TaxID=314037 RepID=A0AAE1CH86_9PEZI|nr:hypothetical protein B0T22DRAFT_66627 [Podospora appendiculata]